MKRVKYCCTFFVVQKEPWSFERDNYISQALQTGILKTPDITCYLQHNRAISLSQGAYNVAITAVS